MYQVPTPGGPWLICGDLEHRSKEEVVRQRKTFIMTDDNEMIPILFQNNDEPRELSTGRPAFSRTVLHRVGGYPWEYHALKHLMAFTERTALWFNGTFPGFEMALF